jgi:putative tryptophan/tyrosine transport system substrate-binding protein
MEHGFWMQWLNSPSDNLKSKVENPKWLGMVAIGVTFAMCGAVTQAQQTPKVPRIGYLAPNLSKEVRATHEAFRLGLRELGYVDGKNIIIEYRWAEGKADRLPLLAAELVRLKVDAIFASGAVQPALAAKNATTTIPIVFVAVDDPVALGLVASLARPGGNITGLSSMGLELSGKRLELVKETVPKASRVAVLWNPDNPSSVNRMKETKAAASSLGIKLQSLEIRESSDLELAFSSMKNEGAGAVVTLNSPNFVNLSKQIVNLAAKSGLPAMYAESQWADVGGLMSYGPNYPDLWRRAATYVDKILKGAKPVDIPVEQPTKFEFIINLKAAKQIGLTIPPNVLVRADRVIR